jgi:hypothetical protein
LASDVERFVVTFYPEDIVVFRHTEPQPLLKMCAFLRWKCPSHCCAVARLRWLDEMLRGSVKSIEEIANRERCSQRKVNMTLSLAFLAPTSSRPRLMDGYRAASGFPAFPIFRHLGANSSES